MEWKYPDNCFAALRCTTVEYATKLSDSGNIRFNCAQVWSDMEKRKRKGQGDLYEGVFAACDPLDINSIIHFKHKYSDVESEFDGKLIYFKRKSVMQMPAYCFYLLKQGLFNCTGKEGAQKIFATITERYFQDFADGVTREQVMLRNEKDRPAIVAIFDINKFISMIKKKLISMGAHESEIVFGYVEYIDKHKPFYSLREPGEELFLKDNSFSYQSEGRIIVNTRNKALIDTLLQKPIDIESIKEFSAQSNVYLEQGAIVEMTANIYKITDDEE
jgi:hypothetical protein